MPSPLPRQVGAFLLSLLSATACRRFLKGAGQFGSANPLAHGDEQLVCCSIGCVSAAEGNSPEVVEDDLLPVLVLIVPTNFPVIGSNALMVPLTELFETSRVLLSGPKLRGASGDAPGLVECRPWISVFTKVPSSVKRSM